MGGAGRLGEYLRARRALTRPEDVGVDRGPTRRRVAGLRREEVARLAGISAEYYLRLEQGRDAHPSEQVLDAIGRALGLDDDARAYVFELARPPLPHGPEFDSELVPAGWQALIDTWTTPAMIHGRRLDVLGSNRQARAVSPSFMPGVNLLRATFLGAEMRSLYRNWEEMSRRLVSYLLALAGPHPDDPQLLALVDDLSQNARFRTLWARHDVTPDPTGINLLDHPVVGPIELRFHRLTPAISGGPTLVVYHAAEGSDSAAALQRLAGSEASIGIDA